ncbi:hypothetical protein BASA81_013241 [Batrachochytrium salamandrivorans]|nr:hypothetical protein BASA81_013241 [Batrachochytrium salamandrivorans]
MPTLVKGSVLFVLEANATKVGVFGGATYMLSNSFYRFQHLDALGNVRFRGLDTRRGLCALTLQSCFGLFEGLDQSVVRLEKCFALGFALPSLSPGASYPIENTATQIWCWWKAGDAADSSLGLFNQSTRQRPEEADRHFVVGRGTSVVAVPRFNATTILADMFLLVLVIALMVDGLALDHSLSCPSPNRCILKFGNFSVQLVRESHSLFASDLVVVGGEGNDKPQHVMFQTPTPTTANSDGIWWGSGVIKRTNRHANERGVYCPQWPSV